MSAHTRLNATHDSSLTSWIVSANEVDTDFPIQNLPFGVFRRRAGGGTEAFRGGVAIGDQIVDLAALCELTRSAGAAAGPGIVAGPPVAPGPSAAELVRTFAGLAAQGLAAAAEPTLNTFMSLGPAVWSALRAALSQALKQGSPLAETLAPALVSQADAELAVPARIGDYTDFFTSIYHATAAGALFGHSLAPNYKWVPIGYHGRSSSIQVSGHEVPRPRGQVMPRGADAPVMIPTRRLDYELEVGIFIGTGNELGTSIPLARAEHHVFGLCLLNDWSARDVQGWEQQPLGPFLGKNFATTVSPWIVTLEALEPFRLPWTRVSSDPQPLPYLEDESVRARGAFDIGLEVWLETARMRAQASGPHRLSQSNFRDSYWTVSQIIAHHTVNGCNLRPGDLLGSGTQSGPQPEEAACLLELTFAGKQPLTLANGEQRAFVEDGDRVILRGRCRRDGYPTLGFGEAAAIVLPAIPPA